MVKISFLFLLFTIVLCQGQDYSYGVEDESSWTLDGSQYAGGFVEPEYVQEVEVVEYEYRPSISGKLDVNSEEFCYRLKRKVRSELNKLKKYCRINSPLLG